MKTRRGGISAFTMAELMVVIVIIGILAAFLLPAVLKGRQTADITQAKQRISALSLALDQFNNDFGFYPRTVFAFNPNLGAFTGTAPPGVPTANYYGDYNYSEALVQWLGETLYGWGVRNCEPHFAQVRGAFQPPTGLIMPTFMPETG